MKQIAQSYKNGDIALLDVPVPAMRSGGVIVRSLYSAISLGTETMKVVEAEMSLLAKARARPDKVAQVLNSAKQQGFVATATKVRNKLDQWTPLGYSLTGVVVEVADRNSKFKVGDIVACGGDKFAMHAEYNWVPNNLCVALRENVDPLQASLTTIASIALQCFRQSSLKLGETAIVVGLGLIGQILSRIMVAAGVNVIGFETDQSRRELAAKVGIQCAVPPDDDGIGIATDVLGGLGLTGADCVFMCAATKSNEPVELAARLLRDRGSIINVGKCKMDLPWNSFYEKELNVRFSRSYGPGRYDSNYELTGIDYPIGYVRWTEERNMLAIVEMLASGRLDLSGIISRVIPFDQAVKTYESIRSGDVKSPCLVFEYPKTERDIYRRFHAGGPSNGARVRASRGVDSVNVAVIGAGNYASSMLLPHLRSDRRVNLCEVVTQTALTAANIQRKFGFERMSTSYVPALEDETIDTVLIATRHDSHAAIVCQALEAGKSVFVEKPLALSFDELNDIKNTVERSGNDRLMVGFNRRFSEPLMKLKGIWGHPASAQTLNYQVNAGKLDEGAWYLDQSNQGSRFAGEGGHFIDVILWWIGSRPTTVKSIASNTERDIRHVLLGFENGATASINYMTGGERTFPKEVLEISGGGKSARMVNFGEVDIWRNGKLDRRRFRGIDKGQKNQMSAFISAVTEQKDMPIPLDTLFAVTEVTLEVERWCRDSDDEL